MTATECKLFGSRLWRVAHALWLVLLCTSPAHSADRGCFGAALQKIPFGFTYRVTVLIGTSMDPAAVYRTNEKCAVQDRSDFVHDEGDGDTLAAKVDANYSLVIGPGQFAATLFTNARSHPALPSAIKGLGGGASMDLTMVDTITVVRPSTVVPTPQQLVSDPTRYIFTVKARLFSASPPACYAKGGRTSSMVWYKTGLAFLGYQEKQLNDVLAPMLVGDDQHKVNRCLGSGLSGSFKLVNGWPGRISVSFGASVLAEGDFSSSRTTEAQVEIPQTDFCIDVPEGTHLTSASGHDYVCTPLKGDPDNLP